MPAGVWDHSFRCHLLLSLLPCGGAGLGGMHCSTLLPPSSRHTLRHPEKAPQGLEAGCFHVKFPELCSEVCCEGPSCMPPVCPLCEFAGRALPRPLSLCPLLDCSEAASITGWRECHNKAVRFPGEGPDLPISPSVSVQQPRLLLCPCCCLRAINRDVGQGEAGRGRRPEAIRMGSQAISAF